MKIALAHTGLLQCSVQINMMTIIIIITTTTVISVIF
jgi:hypothetical protein